ncbi:hypothetical protein [Kineococcus terrestris]|uniref:hypothetical protein n=1 Tax=Kineococcus terrestris TaxID=2044856 RepID=UPI0034DAE33A
MGAPRKTAHQRGLGWAHQQQRAALLRAHVDGAPCPCTDCGPGCPCRKAGRPPGRGLPMWRDAALNVDGMALEADHGDRARSRGGTVADRLLLATCNRSRGDGTRRAAPRENGPRPHWSRQW